MSTSTSFNGETTLRNLTCAAAAVLITAASVWTFADSTATFPGAQLPPLASLRIPLSHAVFGRPEPAVLVD